MQRLLKEPLLHFLLLGAALFALFRFTSKRDVAQPRTVVVTQARIESLTATFTNSFRREPSPAELDQLVNNYVMEEISRREAVALGFDRDDDIIRSRLSQKLEVVPEEMAARVEPTEDELRAWLNAHPDLFRIDRRYTFTQIYLAPERHRGTLMADAAKLLAGLNPPGASADISKLGDPGIPEATFTYISSVEVAKQFGESFSANLDELPPGRWAGPFQSTYGAHLVCVNERSEGRLPALNEARDAVRREWFDVRRQEVRENYYRSLRKQYTVVIEQPESSKLGK